MTAYFDTAHKELWDSLKDDNPVGGFDRIEHQVVFDCTVAAMLPDFPEDLKIRVHKAVLKHGVNMLPVNAPQADFETNDQHATRLSQLFEELHTIFHDVARRALPRFSDNPKMPVYTLYACGEEEREEICRG